MSCTRIEKRADDQIVTATVLCSVITRELIGILLDGVGAISCTTPRSGVNPHV
tara:strand:+ start:3408 stop:3566 length:159 start_codon:yes stop_codon:yes gene_type:complete